MEFNKDAPRYRAGHGDFTAGTGGITQMCPCGDFMEIYKVDKTFRFYTPETLDPEETDPNMHWMSKPVADVGSANKVVARVFIQASEAIKNTPLRSVMNKDEILRCMHRCKELLLICENREEVVCRETERIYEILRKGELKKEGYHFVDFPQIDRLEEHCAAFLSNAKLTIQTLAELINIFYETSFDGPRFDKIVTWSEEKLKHNTDFVEYLKKVQDPIKYIVDLRNAQEHPKKHWKLVVENFALKPGNRIAPPLWHVNNKGPELIHSSMKAIVDFLLGATEAVFLYCVMDNISSSFPFIVREIPENSLDPKCPIKYRIEPYIVMPKQESKKSSIEVTKPESGEARTSK
jgi:hypothetical protein